VSLIEDLVIIGPARLRYSFREGLFNCLTHNRSWSASVLASIGRQVMLVRDYDEALAFYRDKLGFETIVDMQAGERRYVHPQLPTQKGIGIWLLKAETEEQRSRFGRQTAGQPCALI